MGTYRSVAFLGAIAAVLGLAGPAYGECTPETWQDCEGKPWVIGTAETPVGERWWSHPLWGEGDEAGSTNWYARPEVVLRALAEVDTGKVYKLDREYDSTIPTFGGRIFEL